MAPIQLMCVAVLLAGTTVANVAEHRPCEEYSQDVCTVSEVRIEPCSNPKSCRLKKGYPASVSFDFTPNFSSSDVKTGLFWASNTGDLPFTDLYEADGCQLTSCPLESGKSQVLNYNLNLSKKLPKVVKEHATATNAAAGYKLLYSTSNWVVRGTFVFKWKLWNAHNETQVCCFKTEVQLRK